MARPNKWTDAAKLSSDIDAYFSHCEATDDIPRITGLALWLDCEIETLKSYTEKDEFSAPIKRAYNKCFDKVYQGMLTSRNPAGYIFAAKNYGMTDTVQIDMTSTNITIIPPGKPDAID